MRYDAGCNKAHSFDWIFGRVIFHVGIDLLYTGHAQRCGTNAFNLNTKLFEEETQILHHIVRACIADSDRARV